MAHWGDQADGHAGASGLPTTQWSEVARAAGAEPELRRQALGRLIARYLPAFRAHLIRRRNLSSHDAEDVLQGFVCEEVVAAELIARADRTRGRLRGLLFAALEHYASRVRRHGRARKRSPGAAVLSLDVGPEGAGDAGRAEPPAPVAADVFELEWARQVLTEAAARMAAEAGRDADRARVWELFERRVLAPVRDGAEPAHYAALVRELGFASPTQASNALVTGKRSFARHLRGVIGEYACDPAEVESELNELWAIAARAAPGTPDRTAS
ncbi:MAG TPA: hypothetical protein VEA69_03620 [Tepidisphaeraceae bacterium]|nr:hypothetical protein [Tepidisphaeraceae bacterium]